MLARSKVPIVPVFIEGSASWIYHALYNSFIRLSLVWLIREFFNQRNKTMVLRIGQPIVNPPQEVSTFGSFLRKQVYSLKDKKPA